MNNQKKDLRSQGSSSDSISPSRSSVSPGSEDLVFLNFYSELDHLLSVRRSEVARCIGLGNQSSRSDSLDYAAAFTNNFGLTDEWHTRNLPHRDKPELIQFITFRLGDSLPQDVIRQIEDEIKSISDKYKESEKRKRCEKWLDRGYGCCALAKLEMAQVMQDALHYHDGDKYNLLAWTIMPNHVHVLIKSKSSLNKIIQSWKSFTGKWAMANNQKYNLEIQEDAESFWMSEYWDRFIRDEEHFNNTINYILENPMKANLPMDSTAYRFTDCSLTI